MMHLFLVALGGALGSTARYGVARAFPISLASWPWATFIVNVLGSFTIGLLYVWFANRGLGVESARLFWLTGVLGGFTTYSAFALETTLLGLTATGLAYVSATLIGCFGAAWLGRIVGGVMVAQFAHRALL